MDNNKWAVKVRGHNAWYAVQRRPGFTTCSAKEIPGTYEIQFFESREAATKALTEIPEENTTLMGQTWEVVDFDVFMETEYRDVLGRLRVIREARRASPELKAKIEAILGLEAREKVAE